MPVSAEIKRRRKIERIPFNPPGEVVIADLGPEGEPEAQRRVTSFDADTLRVTTHVGGELKKVELMSGTAIAEADLWVSTGVPGKFARLVGEKPARPRITRRRLINTRPPR